MLLLEKYETFSTLLPFSEDWFLLRNKLNLLTRQFVKDRDELRGFNNNKIEREIEKLEKISCCNNSNNLKEQIINLNCCQDNKLAIFRRYKEIRPFGCTEENSKVKKWIDYAINLPHDNVKKINLKRISSFLLKVSEKLDKELYGMNSVKEQILIFLNTKLIGV